LYIAAALSTEEFVHDYIDPIVARLYQGDRCGTERIRSLINEGIRTEVRLQPQPETCKHYMQDGSDLPLQLSTADRLYQFLDAFTLAVGQRAEGSNRYACATSFKHSADSAALA
jgi:hypothetical protein